RSNVLEVGCWPETEDWTAPAMWPLAPIFRWNLCFSPDEKPPARKQCRRIICGRNAAATGGQALSLAQRKSLSRQAKESGCRAACRNECVCHQIIIAGERAAVYI